MARHQTIAFRRKPKRRLIPIYATILLLLFHNFTVAYMNSSYLEQFISTEAVSTIYTVGAALSVLIFLFISRVLHKVGNFKLTMFLLIANFLAVTGMAFATSMEAAIPLFLVFMVAIPLMIFNIDVFLEEEIGNNEGTTGSKRGLILTLGSIVGALSPLAGSLLVELGNGSFTYAYLASAATLVPIIVIMIFYFSDFSDPKYQEIDLFKAIRTFWKNKNIKSVLISHFTLQIFFMSTVVYMPLYITQKIGFSWAEFGILMFAAGMAYTIFEYPIGVVADKYIGEKEMMAFGFLILAITLSWMSFVTVADLVIWCTIMFVMRIGASLVEVTTESYFFKQTKSDDAQIISFFRVTRPLSYVVGTILAGLSLLYVPFNLLFVIIAFLMVIAMFFALDIVDSK